MEEMGLVVGAEMGTSMVSIEGEAVRPLGAGQGERGTPSAPKGVAEGVGCGTKEEGGGGLTLCTTILRRSVSPKATSPPGIQGTPECHIPLNWGALEEPRAVLPAEWVSETAKG